MAKVGMHLSENWGDLLEPGLREIFSKEYDSIPEMRTILFDSQPSKTSYEKISASGAFGDMQVFKGEIPYDESEQLYDHTCRPVRLALGTQVEKDLVEDDLYSVIAQKPREMANSADETYEKYAASVFNNAFTGSGTIVVQGVTVLSNSEGQALCSTAHPYSPSDASTQSNAGSTALSAAEIEVVRLAMRRYKNDRGNRIHNTADLMVVPIDLEEEAYQIIASKGIVDSAENNANFHYGKYKLAVWDYLTDTNNWFMANSSLMKRNGLKWFDRERLSFFKTKEFDTLISKYAITSRVSFGFGNWRFIYGENVT